MKSLEVCAKTVEEAVEIALQKLKARKDGVEVEVLEEGHRGILGFMSKDARIKVTLKETALDRTRAFVEGLIEYFDIEPKISFFEDQDAIRVEFSGKDVGTLIGKHGTTLDALQYLTSLAVNRGEGEYKRILMDAENYRRRREEALEKLAGKMAKRAMETGRNVVLEPMIANERRIIHTALQNHSKVVTKSIGEGHHRRVVISLKG
jgi:spoIIIJ-associated protein